VDKRLHVVVGVIINSANNKVLLSKRTPGQHLEGLWEFPGGKVESDETVISALNRELKEELGIKINSASQLTTVKHDYPDKKVLLDVWIVDDWSNEPLGKEDQELSWSSIDELSQYTFPDANKHIVQTLSLSQKYLISLPSYKEESKLFSVLEKCFSTDMKLFQLRLEQRKQPEFSSLLIKLFELATNYNARIILNGCPSDINEYKVHGIHLNSKELLKYNKRPISEDYILGASCHNETELLHAERINVNYAFLSPIKKTNSHPDVKEIGWDIFNNISRKIKIPIYALGGMSLEDMEVAKSNNAYGIAMISSVWNSE
jgi:8-oxo-dGTP diphosphatase